MSYGLLEKLSRSKLPNDFCGEDVDLIKAYLSAGLVDAVILGYEKTQPGKPLVASARVIKLTAAGRKALKQKQVRLAIARLQGRRA